MNRVDSETEAFTLQDYSRMLNYIDPGALLLDDAEKTELTKRMEQNCVAVKTLLLQLRSFREAHIQIFRRYKHAGFAMSFNAGGSSPYKGAFDSQVIVMDGPNPFLNVKYLPYSEKVFKAYSAIIRTLQEFLGDVVRNKIGSMERSSPGTVPFESYSAIGRDAFLMSNILQKFSWVYPMRARSHLHTINLPNAEAVSIRWYKELDSFLDLCIKNKQKIND